MIGSTPLPFHSVTIKQVRNKTYEPRLEEKMHNALSKEFINQGIEVMNSGGEVELEATVMDFQIGAIASVNEMIVDIGLGEPGFLPASGATLRPRSPIPMRLQR